VPAVAPGEARRLNRARAATLRLAFLCAAACSGCTNPSPAELAERADHAHGTLVFRWLAGHDPSAIVAWRIAPSVVAAIVPNAHVSAASSRPCAQAKAEHALLLLVVPDGGPGRDEAEDCGFALERDRGAIIVAPR
jgi:hypothetical protein